MLFFSMLFSLSKKPKPTLAMIQEVKMRLLSILSKKLATSSFCKLNLK